MPDPAQKRRATYEDVLNAPENMIAEILDGELHLMPRPKRRHLRTASGLGAFLFGAYDAGVNGPGGWTIIAEPELHLGPEPDILVPDLGGWRDGRLPDDGEVDDPFITIVPDWVCEILSPGTQRIDRVKKMPIYARERVPHVWLVDPREKTVEVFRLGDARYTLMGTFGGDEALVAEPFEAVDIPPAFVWAAKGSPAKQISTAQLFASIINREHGMVDAHAWVVAQRRQILGTTMTDPAWKDHDWVFVVVRTAAGTKRSCVDPTLYDMGLGWDISRAVHGAVRLRSG